VAGIKGLLVALAAVVIATIVRWAVDPWLGNYTPVATYVAAVAIVAMYAGPGPAVLTMVLGALVADLLFIGPFGTLWQLDQQHLVGLGIFLFSSSMLILMARNLRRSRSRLRRSKVELEARAAQLQAADERKDRFIALLAHELRNPLASIANAVAVMRLQVDGSASANASAVDIIDRQTRQLKYLVSELLDTARIDNDLIVLDRSSIDLTALVRQCVDNVRPRCAQAGITLGLVAEEPLWLQADGARIVQVLDNLLDNACKFTKPGGCIRVTVGRAGSQALVSVRDDGIGIEPEDLTTIFEAFETAAGPQASVESGLGLGLHLVRRLVQMHGGRVEAKSDGAGRGSDFLIRLPLVDAPHAAALPAPTATAHAAARRVLVIDDNEDAARMLQLILESAGHDVCTAFDGTDGLALAEQCHPAVAFVDLRMPGMDGYEVARRLRARFGQHLRLIAVTGFSHEEHQERSRQAGFDEHLVKPPSASAIIAQAAVGCGCAAVCCAPAA
jgi:signal transduction histidine kinase/ActR/RegA family two-component response regulator